MYLIGLTGGIASGKSTVSRRLAQHGAVHIDADQLARRAVEIGSTGLAQIRAEFGERVIAPDGSLNRAALGEIIFGDDTARQRLNHIVHPIVRALSLHRFAEAEAENPNAVVVYDVPLLVEAEVDHPFDLVVVVQATPATRIRRLIKERDMSRAAAESRVAAQASDAERLARADVVIDSDGTLAHTMSQTDELWHRVKAAQHGQAQAAE